MIFKQKGLAHFLHSRIPPYVEKKRKQLLQDIDGEIQKAQMQGFTVNEPVIHEIKKAINNIDNIVDNDSKLYKLKSGND